MKINLDKDNYIINYATIGDVENSIEADDFEFEYPCNYYQYKKGKIILDKNKLKEFKAETSE